MLNEGKKQNNQGLGGSKVAREPIAIPKGTEVQYKDLVLQVKGPLGMLKLEIHPLISLEMEDGLIRLTPQDQYDKQCKSLHGLYGRLISNMLKGVSEGFQRKLLLVGTGYRAKITGNALDLQIGVSHPVLMPIPSEVQCTVENNTEIVLKSYDKEKLGQFAADIRKKRPPEPYKLKGIRYEGEHLIRKAGKSGK